MPACKRPFISQQGAIFTRICAIILLLYSYNFASFSVVCSLKIGSALSGAMAVHVIRIFSINPGPAGPRYALPLQTG